MTVEILDTHCHLDVAEFDADRPAVLQRATAQGVCGIVVPGVAAAGWRGLRDFCAGDARLYPAYGLHPVCLEQHRPADLQALETWLAHEPAVAVGEIGLDYYVGGLDKRRQQDLFEAQLQLARAAGLPVLLHVRKAHDPVLATLRRIRVCGGIAHAFNGSLQQAAQYRDLGFKLGFGGMLTFERSSKLRKLARELPLDDLVLETDAPDMTVVQHRGERNSPEYLPLCLAALAEVRDEPREELARRTTANARAVLRLDDWNPAGG
ncbi:MAG TPA: TatD family hydrolase [Gammaproteobacteria bacterium]|nr:TatD family hydrolase [Gammaproteobacteria bacterium]